VGRCFREPLFSRVVVLAGRCSRGPLFSRAVVFATIRQSDTKQIHDPVKLCASTGTAELVSPDTTKFALLKISEPEPQYITFSNGAKLGTVSPPLKEALTKFIYRKYRLHFEVLAPLKDIRITTNGATALVHINVYGPQTEGVAIGQELSNLKIYLQRPVVMRAWTIYNNPHGMWLPPERSTGSPAGLIVATGRDGDPPRSWSGHAATQRIFYDVLVLIILQFVLSQAGVQPFSCPSAR
jgi:hypothetical protein